MRHNQYLPPLFESHIQWIRRLFQEDAIPKAWIFNHDRWQLQTTQQTSGLIEYLEHTLIKQDNIGILQFCGTFSHSEKDYTILYLYDGNHFSHTIFHPRSQPGTTCSDSDPWWIETWNIEHVLSQ